MLLFVSGYTGSLAARVARPLPETEFFRKQLGFFPSTPPPAPRATNAQRPPQAVKPREATRFCLLALFRQR